MMRRIVAVEAVLVSALASCSHGNPGEQVQTTPAPSHGPVAVAMSKNIRAENVLTVRYAGKWEFISHRGDGRFQGESARSFHSGDSITVVFSGNRLRIYGIRGKNGGIATIVLAGKDPAQVNFYAPAKVTHALLYDSGPLSGTIQTAGIVVTAPPPPRRQGYVNIDELEAIK